MCARPLLPWSFVLCILLCLVRDATSAYNLSGGLCLGYRWIRLQKMLWGVANNQRELPRAPHLLPLQKDCWQCPEGIVSLYLATYAQGIHRESILGGLAFEIAPHYCLPILRRRLQLGGWPSFGVFSVLQDEVLRVRFPEAAPMLLNTTPRFHMASLPAPEQVLPSWFMELPPEWAGAEGLTIDIGMRKLLWGSPILRLGYGLAMVDVGVYDGASLFASSMTVGRGHAVLGFEPLPSNREVAASTFRDKGLGDSLRIWDGTGGNCTGVNLTGHFVPRACECAGGASGCATLVSAGLSAVDHLATMPSAGALSSVAMSTFADKAVKGAGEPETVRLLSGAVVVERWFREVLGRRCVDIHLLKMDIEGGEFAALRGLEPLFAEHRVRFIFLEVWPIMMLAWGAEPLGALRYLAHYGFICRSLRSDGLPESFDEFVARHTPDHLMTDFRFSTISFDDLLCEDMYWTEPCGGALS